MQNPRDFLVWAPLQETIIAQLEKYVAKLKNSGIKREQDLPARVKKLLEFDPNRRVINKIYSEESEEEMLNKQKTDQETDQEETFSEEIDLEREDNQEETFSEITEEDEQEIEETIEAEEETYTEEE